MLHIFEDYGNTSKNPCYRRPSAPKKILEPLDKNLRKQIIHGLASIISYEWFHEVELSSEPLHICGPPSPIQCFVHAAPVMVPYNLIVGVNIMSSTFALTYLGRILNKNYQDLEIWPMFHKTWDWGCT